MKKWFGLAFAGLLLLTVLLLMGACGGSQASVGGTVHMNDTNFTQSSLTIPKGSSLTLVTDTATMHIISRGTWANGSPQPLQEAGAPQVDNLQISGQGASQTIGPFTTPGTYHFYCTVHPNMSLTVTVQ